MSSPSVQSVPFLHYAAAALACLVVALVAQGLQGWLDLANIVMVFLLAVLLVARYSGRGPAVLAAFLSVALFDFFFVPPQLSFSVSDAQYLITFVVMLAVALVTGQLTAGLKREAEVARAREARSVALYGMARELAGALTPEQVAEIGQGFLRQAVGVDGLLLLPDGNEALQPLVGTAPKAETLRAEAHLALIAYRQETPVECDPMADGGFAIAYFPLRAPTRPRGVLAVAPLDGNPETVRHQSPLLETTASLLAIALERLHYADAARTAEVEATGERLRSSLLSALSHDVRTPLTALRGTAETLALAGPAQQRELAEAVRDQAVRLSRMVSNLLDMARLQAGKVVLRKEWQAMDEVVGSSLKLLEGLLAGREIRLDLAAPMPLVEFDAVLLERVLCNLLENAAKYSPAGSVIAIAVHPEGDRLWVRVTDQGRGFPPGKEESVFALFERGVPESLREGVGLGLAICRGIVEAHGGRIQACNPPQGGAEVSFWLPLGQPPALAEEPEFVEEQRS